MNERQADSFGHKGGERLEKKLLEALYRRYYRELYLYVYSICGQRSLTEDILQETFLKAFTVLKDSHTNMRAWLYLVARNLCYNDMKWESRIHPLDAAEELAVMEGPLAQIIQNEEKQRLWDAMQRLKSPWKEILLLQYFCEFGQKEIAALLQMSPENVRVQAYRAKKELKRELEREPEKPEKRTGKKQENEQEKGIEKRSRKRSGR